MKHLTWLISCLVVTTVTHTVWGEPSVTISGGRILLGDVVPGTKSEAAAVDLGRAPSPGGSRLLVRLEVLRAVRDAGLSPESLQIPEVIRVVSAKRSVSPDELAQRIMPLLQSKLRSGVRLVSAQPRTSVDMSPGAVVIGVEVPRQARRAGIQKLTALVELQAPGGASFRVAVPIVVDVSQSASQPDLRRGAEVRLVVRKSGAEIGADALALVDAEVGEIVQFKVLHTGRVIKARVESAEVALVVAQ